MKNESLLAVVLFLASCSFTQADGVSTAKPVATSQIVSNPFREILSQVPAAELPSKSASLVKQAKAREWGVTTVNVVKAALEINSASAPSVVGAIARAVPEMASIAAGTAASLQPKMAGAIVSAAATAAPGKVGKIVAAVCREVPNAYGDVAICAARCVPGSDMDILDAVSDAIPGLKPSIDSYMASHAGFQTVAAVVTQAKPVSMPSADSTASSGGLTPPSAFSAFNQTLPRGAAVSAPVVPASITPQNTPPSTSGSMPSGSSARNYAKP